MEMNFSEQVIDSLGGEYPDLQGGKDELLGYPFINLEFS